MSLIPFITEERDAPVREYRCFRRSGSEHIANWPTGRDEKQFGFRSGQLARKDREALGLRTFSPEEGKTWANNTEVIRALDMEFNSRPGRVADGVNERTYECVGHSVSHSPWGYQTADIATGAPRVGNGVGALYLRSQTPDDLPGLFPSDSILEGEASGMMRRSVPSAPAFNLTRALGELRQAPLLFRASNYRPSSFQEAGSAYLNYVFGLAPTGRDLARLASTIIEADAIVREFIAHERRIVRRRRTMVMYQSHLDWTFTPSSDILSSLTLSGHGSRVFGLIRAYCPPWGIGSTGSLRSAMRYYVSADIVGELRMFASFEYFIPRPTGLMDRLSRYTSLARKVLGGGLDESTTYDLLPWSWLVDWFVDIGGLLRYQTAVAANSVVASRSGWVYEARTTLSSSAGCRPEFHTAYGPSTLESVSKYYSRHPGGPYSLTDGWALTGSQWAILAALGLSRQNRV